VMRPGDTWSPAQLDGAGGRVDDLHRGHGRTTARSTRRGHQQDRFTARTSTGSAAAPYG
jgi:hypothetical protein